MRGLVHTLDKEAKVPGRKEALDWCCWGMLEAVQGEHSDVQTALLPAQLRNALSSKAKVLRSAAGELF